MSAFTHLPVRAVAAATLVGTIVLATSLPAASGGLVQAAAKSKHAPADPIEGRVKELHSKLHITAAQEPQWNTVAQVMRDNAKAMAEFRKQAAEKAQSMNAVDALKSYASVIDAHADGVRKFIPTFQTLYDSMSAEQKKAADAFFRNRTRAAEQRTR